jgi:GR25 family glycosyltransferase involved in LPS biosynthesis
MAIYCINLKHRQDRKHHSLQQFKKLGIPEYKVNYLPFEKDSRGGVYGCFDSHVKVWKDFFMFHPHETYALVFEDDFVAPKHGKELLHKANAFVQKHYDEIDFLNLHNMESM